MCQILLFFLLSSLVPRVSPDGENPRDEYNVRSNQAAELANQGHLEDAIRIWVDILDEVPTEHLPYVLVNLAWAYDELGHLPEAWYYASRCPRSGEFGLLSAELCTGFEHELRETHRLVEVSCEPEDARVVLQAGEIQRSFPCPFSWWFSPGRHEVSVEHKEFEPRVLVIDSPEEKKTVRLPVILKSIYGVLRIEGPEETGQIVLNGRFIDQVPCAAKLKPGKYRVEIVRDGEVRWTETISIEAGTTETRYLDHIASVPAPVDRSPFRRENLWKWITLGTGVGLAGVGGVCHYLADANKKALPRDDEDTYNRRFKDEVAPKANAAYALYGIGAAAAVTGATALLWTDAGPDRQSPREAVQIVPLWLQGGGGFVFDIRF